MREERERVTGDLEMNASFANPKGRGELLCLGVCMGYIEEKRAFESTL